MRIPCTIEWVSHKAGWQAAAQFRGTPITVVQAQSFALARKRLLRALEKAGATGVELQIRSRMPKQIEADLAKYRELAEQIPRLEAERDDLKLRLARRLCTEFNFSEREAAAWLGVSGAHVSAKLRANTVDSGEFSRDDSGPKP